MSLITRFLSPKVASRGRQLWWYLSGRGRVIHLSPIGWTGNGRRALLIYLNEWWNPLDYFRKKSSHQNLHQAHDIARILQERGYACDVVHYKNKEFVVTTPYDLIISHRFDDQFLPKTRRPGSKYIGLTTTQAPHIHNTVARQRMDEVIRRRQCALTSVRDAAEDLSFFRQADALASFGSNGVAEGWRQIFSGPVRSFKNWPFQLKLPAGKDWHHARTGFLFLASGSQVHKGLDLVLEAAQRLPQARVYVCSYFKDEKDFCAAFHHELFASPNVHPIGRVNVRSRLFQRILRETAFTILPSASEASPGSVIQTAYAGLIPVVSRYSGEEHAACVFIESLTVDAVTGAMQKCLAMPVNEILERSACLQQWVAENCSREQFVTRWNTILDEVAGPADQISSPDESAPHA